MAKTAETKATPVPRENPVARAERLLAEAKQKAAERARTMLDKAYKDLDIATDNRDKWQRFVDERQERVRQLEADLGYDQESPADANSSEEE